mgnify:CR=1 FL=1
MGEMKRKPPKQMVSKSKSYRGIATLVVTYDYARALTQITPINLDAATFWLLAKQVMDTAHNAVVAEARLTAASTPSTEAAQ